MMQNHISKQSEPEPQVRGLHKSHHSIMNVIVADDMGLVKHVDIEKGIVLATFGTQSRENSINRMTWADINDETRGIVTVSQNGGVKHIKSFELSDAVSIASLKNGCSGIEITDSRMHICNDTGKFETYTFDASKPQSFGRDIVQEYTFGKKTTRMHQSSFTNHVGTGGNEEEFSLWDIEAGGKSVFKARNVPHDKLELRVPVWNTDFCFFKTDNSKKSIGGGLPDVAAVCTAYAQLRIYDTRAQRRPVRDITLLNATDKHQNNRSASTHHLNCVTYATDNTVIVADSAGEVFVVDIRKMQQTFRLKGFAGSVRHVSKHPAEPYVASVGLDRHLHIHNCDNGSLFRKVYLKQRLCCVLFSAAQSSHKPTPSTKRKSKKKAVEMEDRVEDLSDDEAHEENDAPRPATAKKRIKTLP